MMTNSTTTVDDGTLFLGEAWSDPIETGIRDRIRGFIEPKSGGLALAGLSYLADSVRNVEACRSPLGSPSG